ncbi:hypothetical protein QTP88_016342 [Uroleucon formosanum]
MFSVLNSNRGLPHAHILIWLLNKLHSNEVDDIISAEIPDPVTDPRLHDIVTTQMVHGPCGALNPLSPCMADGKCTKRYPRPLVAETVTGNDGYPVYRRRSKEDNDTQLVLIENVFPNISENYKNYAWLSQRAILAAKNNDVHALNFTIQSKIAGDLVTYKSVDSITNPDDVVNYPTEFLNSLEIPGFPPHNLQLKVGTVIMILRNLNPPRLCNGTRLSVKRLMPNLIEATIINGKYAGENVCIPRIPMIPTDLPFDFKRLQFPVRLAFAMTINKSQGQSLSVCGINLENHCFSHGQLYVACSRVGKPSALFVLTSDQKKKNVVYQRGKCGLTIK